MNEDEMVAAVAEHFRSFGGGKKSAWTNPIADALADQPPQFAAGVDIREVVRFIRDQIGSA